MRECLVDIARVSDLLQCNGPVLVGIEYGVGMKDVKQHPFLDKQSITLLGRFVTVSRLYTKVVHGCYKRV